MLPLFFLYFESNSFSKSNTHPDLSYISNTCILYVKELILKIVNQDETPDINVEDYVMCSVVNKERRPLMAVCIYV